MQVKCFLNSYGESKTMNVNTNVKTGKTEIKLSQAERRWLRCANAICETIYKTTGYEITLEEAIVRYAPIESDNGEQETQS